MEVFICINSLPLWQQKKGLVLLVAAFTWSSWGGRCRAWPPTLFSCHSPHPTTVGPSSTPAASVLRQEARGTPASQASQAVLELSGSTHPVLLLQDGQPFL